MRHPSGGRATFPAVTGEPTMTTKTHPPLRFEDLLRATQEEFPGFTIKFKEDSVQQKFIHNFLRIITFGAQREYATRYNTMIGRTMWVPTRAMWEGKSDADKYALILHEREHMRQERRNGKVLHAVRYLLVLPLGWNPYRRRCEQEGYEKTLWAVYTFKGEEALRDPKLFDYIAVQFYSGMYGWMWTKRQTHAWLRDAIERVVRGEITNA
jgi:hypothetical protein